MAQLAPSMKTEGVVRPPESNCVPLPLESASPSGPPALILIQVMPSFDSAYPMTPWLGPPNVGFADWQPRYHMRYRLSLSFTTEGWYAQATSKAPAAPMSRTAPRACLPGFWVQLRPSVEVASATRRVLVESLAEYTSCNRWYP